MAEINLKSKFQTSNTKSQTNPNNPNSKSETTQLVSGHTKGLSPFDLESIIKGILRLQGNAIQMWQLFWLLIFVI
ncbi:hypothetical protein D1AOALGA4SA_4691 [Olavius algarvensis Delta 1 endosymbiont]|nr:hypothetical protein D1AOALGA4SA_4691 [Olavius algarvensis Delta 1 endosymbiont]